MIQTFIFIVMVVLGCIVFRNPIAAFGLGIAVIVLINKVWERMDI